MRKKWALCMTQVLCVAMLWAGVAAGAMNVPGGPPGVVELPNPPQSEPGVIESLPLPSVKAETGTSTSSYVYTFGDLILFGYVDQTQYSIYNSSGTQLYTGTLNAGEHFTCTPGGGIYKVDADQRYALVVGDPVSKGVTGFYAMDQYGKAVAKEFYTVTCPNYFYDEHLIIFAYEDDTTASASIVGSSTPLWEGTLQAGEHAAITVNSQFVHVTANKNVSALSYYDQGFQVPASNGTFVGNLFYTYVGSITNCPNDLNVISYADGNEVTITNTSTGATIWSGRLQRGEVHSENMTSVYTTVTSSAATAVSVSPVTITSYYHMLVAADSTGVGLGSLFYIPTIYGQLDVFSYADGNTVTVTDTRRTSDDPTDDIVVWTGTLNLGEHVLVNSSPSLYEVAGTTNLAVFESYGGGWGGCFMPLYFGQYLTVEDATGNPISGANVTQIKANGVKTDYVADNQGRVYMSNLETGDQLWARQVLQTIATDKELHGGTDGKVLIEVCKTNDHIANNSVEHYTYNGTDNTLVVNYNLSLVHLIVVAEYDMDSSDFTALRSEVTGASQYLFEATDGQMCFGTVKLYDNQGWSDATQDKKPWNNADIKLEGKADRPYSNGISVYAGKSGRVFFGNDWRDWTMSRTIVHELGHYLFGIYDEYINAQGDRSTVQHGAVECEPYLYGQSIGHHLTNLSAAASSGAATVSILNGAHIQAGSIVGLDNGNNSYVREYANVLSVTATKDGVTLTLDEPLGNSYPVGTGLYLDSPDGVSLMEWQALCHDFCNPSNHDPDKDTKQEEINKKSSWATIHENFSWLTAATQVKEGPYTSWEPSFSVYDGNVYAFTVTVHAKDNDGLSVPNVRIYHSSPGDPLSSAGNQSSGTNDGDVDVENVKIGDVLKVQKEGYQSVEYSVVDEVESVNVTLQQTLIRSAVEGVTGVFDHLHNLVLSFVNNGFAAAPTISFVQEGQIAASSHIPTKATRDELASLGVEAETVAKAAKSEKSGYSVTIPMDTNLEQVGAFEIEGVDASSNPLSTICEFAAGECSPTEDNVVSNKGYAEVHIPKGALSEATTLVITTTPVIESASAELSLVGLAQNVTLSSGALTGEATLIMFYDTTVDGNTVDIYRWSAAKNQWTALNGAADSSQRSITAHVNQFGTFAVFAKSVTELTASAKAVASDTGAVSFTGSAAGGKMPYTFLWNFGDGSVSYEQSPTHQYASSGKYDVVLSLTDAEQTVTTTIQVSVNVGSTCGCFQGSTTWTMPAGPSGKLAAGQPSLLAAYLEARKALATSTANSGDWILLCLVVGGLALSGLRRTRRTTAI